MKEGAEVPDMICVSSVTPREIPHNHKGVAADDHHSGMTSENDKGVKTCVMSHNPAFTSPPQPSMFCSLGLSHDSAPHAS